MRLVKNWRVLVRRSYAFHFGWLSGASGLIAVLANNWSLFEGLLPIPPLVFALIGVAFGFLASGGRVVEQRKISGGSDADQ